MLYFCDLFQPYFTFSSDHVTPKFDGFVPLPRGSPLPICIRLVHSFSVYRVRASRFVKRCTDQ